MKPLCPPRSQAWAHMENLGLHLALMAAGTAGSTRSLWHLELLVTV